MTIEDVTFCRFSLMCFKAFGITPMRETFKIYCSPPLRKLERQIIVKIFALISTFKALFRLIRKLKLSLTLRTCTCDLTNASRGLNLRALQIFF